MNKNLPIAALVGMPNVGKSTLLNKIAGKHLAITSDVAGTTRDRQYLDVSWNNQAFTFVDTAGLTLDVSNELDKNVQKQIQIALKETDAVILLADGKETAAALDNKILKEFRSLKKPILLAVNKIDSPKNIEQALTPFYKYGIKDVYAISAITGRGIGDLLDKVSEIISAVKKEEPESEEISENSILVSIIGKPNVGKSSIFNSILKEERVVVSPIPGTTRTAIDSNIKIDDVNYTFIDTAGLKKKEFRQTEPDIFSGFMSFRAIRRSDVCLFVIDTSDEITKQDQRVASEIFDMEKGCVILANKADLLKPDTLSEGGSAPKKGRGNWQNKDEDRYRFPKDKISLHFPFLWMCPIFFVSAKTGEGIDEAIKTIKPIFEARNKTISDEILTEFLGKKLKTNPPKLLRDQKRPKVFGLRQIDVNPPKFELLVNHPAAISQQFRKFMENSIIRELDFWGTPIILKLIGKDKA